MLRNAESGLQLRYAAIGNAGLDLADPAEGEPAHQTGSNREGNCASKHHVKLRGDQETEGKQPAHHGTGSPSEEAA